MAVRVRCVYLVLCARCSITTTSGDFTQLLMAHWNANTRHQIAVEEVDIRVWSEKRVRCLVQ